MKGNNSIYVVVSSMVALAKVMACTAQHAWW
jgi:hypothetical protein